MFLTGFNDYEHDRFQNLNIRFVGGGGAGVKAVKSENLQLDFDAGVDYQRENFMNGLTPQFRRSQFRRQPALQGVQGDVPHPVDARLHQPDRHRRLPHEFRPRQHHRSSRDGWAGTSPPAIAFSAIPVQGRQRNDLLLSTGFRLTFARVDTISPASAPLSGKKIRAIIVSWPGWCWKGRSANSSRACRRGERDAFRALFETYQDKIYSIALRFSGDEALAMDIAQDTFLKLFSCMAEFRGDSVLRHLGIPPRSQ